MKKNKKIIHFTGRCKPASGHSRCTALQPGNGAAPVLAPGGPCVRNGEEDGGSELSARRRGSGLQPEGKWRRSEAMKRPLGSGPHDHDPLRTATGTEGKGTGLHLTHVLCLPE